MKHRYLLSSVVAAIVLTSPAQTAFAQDFWEQTSGPGGGTVWSLAINSTGHIFAGTEFDGAFRSTDNGDTWTEINNGLTNLGVLSFAINSTDHIFTGTLGSGVFRSLKTTTAVREVAGELPSSFSLAQNYPNPFNPTTALRFDLPQVTEVVLIVYDLLGREVVRLVDGYLGPGYHQTVWNGQTAANRPLPSGIYIARLVTPEFTRSIKMVLLQ